MIVIIMGMGYSGTTLCAKTLHHSGINMNPQITGNYKAARYEDQEAKKIINKMLCVVGFRSLCLPEFSYTNNGIILEIKNYISNKEGDWGFKYPYLTFCYDIWKKYLPQHFAIGIKRNPDNLVNHYRKGGAKQITKKQSDRVKNVQKIYNNLMEKYNIPIITFEDFIKYGPAVLEKIIGHKLVDVRDGRKH